VKYSIAAALVFSCAINIAWASSIDLTGGSLTAGSNTTILTAGATGTFSATDARTDTVYESNSTGGTEQVSSATASAQIGVSGLNIHASSDGSTYFHYPDGQLLHSILGTQGSLTFDVTAAGAFDYSSVSRGESQEIIRDAGGATVLSIGCLNTNTGCWQGTSFAGSLALAQGIYTLSFTASAFQLVGTTQDSTMSFSLQPVPLPPGLPLLGSALVGLLFLTCRRRSAVGWLPWVGDSPG